MPNIWGENVGRETYSRTIQPLRDETTHGGAEPKTIVNNYIYTLVPTIRPTFPARSRYPLVNILSLPSCYSLVANGSCGILIGFELLRRAHSNVWFSHPRTYGKGSRQWYVSGLFHHPIRTISLAREKRHAEKQRECDVPRSGSKCTRCIWSIVDATENAIIIGTLTDSRCCLFCTVVSVPTRPVLSGKSPLVDNATA
jgi:hypothetical protein